MKLNKKIKILHCPSTTGGNPQLLSKIENDLGFHSVSFSTEDNYLNYESDFTLPKFFNFIFIQQLFLWFYVIKIKFSYDVIHYNAGKSLLPWHVPKKFIFNNILLNKFINFYVFLAHKYETFLLGKKIILVTYQGDDARQGSFLLENYQYSIAHFNREYYTPYSDYIKKQNIIKFNLYANHIFFLNPDLKNFLPKRAKFIPYLLNKNIKCQKRLLKRNIFRIIHAPTNRNIKGTQLIIDTIKKIKIENNLNIELKIIENISYDEAINEYQNADLAIDQLYAGWYGVFALECLSLGIPVISYIRTNDLVDTISKSMKKRLPIINANIDNLENKIIDFYKLNVLQKRKLSLKSKSFAFKFHDPVKITKEISRYYT